MNLYLIQPDGSVTFNRSAIMTEAWATIHRLRAQGTTRTLSDALRSAWFHARIKVDAQRSGRRPNPYSGHTTDQLLQAIHELDCIDRPSEVQREIRERMGAALINRS